MIGVVKDVVAGSMNIACSEIFDWNKHSRKPRSVDFGYRHIKVMWGTRQPHFQKFSWQLYSTPGGHSML